MVLKHLPSGLSSFFIKDKSVFSNDPKIIRKKTPDRPILYNWVFEKFILVYPLFTKALQSLETCALANNNLFEKLASSSELSITFDVRFKVTSLRLFIPNFDSLSWKLENFTLKVLYWVTLYWYHIKAKINFGTRSS